MVAQHNATWENCRQHIASDQNPATLINILSALAQHAPNLQRPRRLRPRLIRLRQRLHDRQLWPIHRLHRLTPLRIRYRRPEILVQRTRVLPQLPQLHLNLPLKPAETFPIINRFDPAWIQCRREPELIRPDLIKLNNSAGILPPKNSSASFSTRRSLSTRALLEADLDVLHGVPEDFVACFGDLALRGQWACWFSRPRKKVMRQLWHLSRMVLLWQIAHWSFLGRDEVLDILSVEGFVERSKLLPRYKVSFACGVDCGCHGCYKAPVYDHILSRHGQIQYAA